MLAVFCLLLSPWLIKIFISHLNKNVQVVKLGFFLPPTLSKSGNILFWNLIKFKKRHKELVDKEGTESILL